MCVFRIKRQVAGMSVSVSPLLQHRVLVLNASFEAINICTAKRALKLLLSEKACTKALCYTILKTECMLALRLPTTSAFHPALVKPEEALI